MKVTLMMAAALKDLNCEIVPYYCLELPKKPGHPYMTDIPAHQLQITHRLRMICQPRVTRQLRMTCDMPAAATPSLSTK